MKVYRVHADSAHFSFDAYGETEAHALQVFSRTIKRHVGQTGATPGWADMMIRDARATEIEVGSGYRDGEHIIHVTGSAR